MTGIDVPTGYDDTKKKPSTNFLDSFMDMEKTRVYLTASLTKYTDRVTLDTVRPLPTFLGISGPSMCLAPDAFAPPLKKIDKDTAEKVTQRFSLNFAYFVSNYALIFIGTFIIVTLMHPGMIIYSSVVYGLWKGHGFMIKNQTPLVIMGKDIGAYITAETRTRILYLITTWVVMAYCFKPFVIVVGLTGLLITSHAFMRDPKHIESNRNFLDDSGSDASSGSGVVVENMDAV